VREVYEETGLTVEPIKLLKVDYYQLTAEQNIKWKENINKIEHYFLCKIKKGRILQSEGNKNNWSDEDAGNTGFIRFFSQEELQKTNISPAWLKSIHQNL
jgi:8-oxo-dGTP pyrophosphatase MutT (NUDIX family)